MLRAMYLYGNITDKILIVYLSKNVKLYINLIVSFCLICIFAYSFCHGNVVYYYQYTKYYKNFKLYS